MAKAVLSALIKGEDNLSSVFDSIANKGAAMLEQWQDASSTISTAFDETASSAGTASTAISDAVSSTNSLASSITTFDKSATDAIDTTNELADVTNKAERALLGTADGATDAASAFAGAIQEAEDFKAATAALETELQELQNAYVGTALQKGKNSDEAQALQARIEDLSQTVADNRAQLDDLSTSAGDTGSSVSGMASKIEQVLVSAGIAKLIGTITQAVVQMGNEFSNAEATIVRASGASGRELNNLQENMFNVFATARNGDLSGVATAITEVNTRMDLQGDELERVTSLFMDYADMNGTYVAGSIRTVSQLMTRWQVDTSETASVLDKLTLASQMSGKSVDALGYELLKNQATFDALGWALDENIALLAGLEQSGINSQAVMYGLRRSVVYFSQDGKDANEALKEIIAEIYALGDSAESTALAVDTFGVRAGPEMAFAIRNGKLEIEDWVAAIATADGTLAATAAAATTLEERWTQASNQMGVAFTSILGPAVAGVSGVFADMKLGVAEFLADSPVLVAVLSGLATGFVLVAGALAAYKTAVAVGTVATAIFGTTLSAALWPLTIAVGAIAAITAGFVLLFNRLSNANEEFNALTATAKNHYEAVQDLRREYELANMVYGENSAEVSRLRGEMEASQLVFEANRLTMEEFLATNDRLIDSHRRTADGFAENIVAIDREEQSAEALIGRLAALTDQTGLTAAEQMQMSAIVDELNSGFPEMALTIDEMTGALNLSVDAMRDLAQAQAEQDRLAAGHQAFVQALQEEASIREQLALATEQYAAAQQRADEATWSITGATRRNANNDLAAFREEYERLSSVLAENLDIQAQTEAAWERQSQATQDAADAVVSYEDAVNRAIQSVQSDMELLVESYNLAFEAARENIGRTIGLFDTMSTEATISITDMTTAMQSQMEFLDLCAENLRLAAELGIDKGLIASLSDGSTESAGHINAIIEEIERLGGSTEEMSADATAFVEDFNTAFQGTQEAKDDFAATIADMQTDFSDGMDDIESRLYEAIDNMNMSTDAAEAARETIAAYIAQIRDMAGEAHDAAASVARSAVSALGGRRASLDIPGFATGTTDAPGVFIAGEEGPELIVGAGGSTVFTANETQDILAAARTPISTSAPVGYSVQASSGASGGQSTQEKRLTLSLEGRGEIQVSGNATDQEAVWEYVAPRLKNAFLGILREEVFEEGDASYAF